jgi:hypothetical protein
MCGRAKLPDDVSEIKLDLKIDFDEIGDYRPRWNAAPTSKPARRHFQGRHTHPDALLAPLHGRMPVVIPPDCLADWLGENSMTGSAVKNLLRPYPDQAMAWAVDRRVGNVRNDGPDLFAPIELAPAP